MDTPVLLAAKRGENLLEFAGEGPKAVQNWYALHVRSCHESLVESTLQARGVESFYPSFERINKRKETIRLPFFPGYVFGRFEIRERPFLPQIIRVVGTSAGGIAIAETEIEVMKVLKEQKIAAEPCAYLNAGDQVRIKQGSLEGYEGFVTYVKGRTRVVLSVNLIQRSVSVEVDASWLEPVRDKSALRKAA